MGLTPDGDLVPKDAVNLQKNFCKTMNELDLVVELNKYDWRVAHDQAPSVKVIIIKLFKDVLRDKVIFSLNFCFSKLNFWFRKIGFWRKKS